jgi:hypothetical protein
MKLSIELSTHERIGALVLLGVMTALGTGVALADVPHTFSSGQLLSAADMNDNFDSLSKQIATIATQVAVVQERSDGPIAFSDSSGTFETQSKTLVPIPNCAVSLDTHGGVVRLELTPAGENSRLFLISGSTASSWLFAYVNFERSVNGVDWVSIGDLDFGGVPSSSGSTAVPPGAFSLYDAPGEGTWTYRVTIRNTTDTGDSTVNVNNVRLAAREIGG